MSLPIADRVHSVLVAEHGPLDAAGLPDRLPTDHPIMDARDWGLAYGIAYTLVRMENPFMSEEFINERAGEEARKVFNDMYATQTAEVTA